MSMVEVKMNALTKQASFFLKEKIKTARLTFTDVTPAQLLAEEATDGNPGGPEARALKIISKAAFDVDDYWRIVGILHKRLENFDKRNWRPSYKALIVLEYLLTHGPESISNEFLMEKDTILEMQRFQHIDERGYNWGLNVRKKCERILKLLEKGPYLKEERAKARKISRGIEGFGSFCHRTSSGQEFTHESSITAVVRCNSQFNDTPLRNSTEAQEPLPLSNAELNTKEKLNPTEEGLVEEEVSVLNNVGESKPLLGEKSDEMSIMATQDHHPFDVPSRVSAAPLL